MPKRAVGRPRALLRWLKRTLAAAGAVADRRPKEPTRYNLRTVEDAQAWLPAEVDRVRKGAAVTVIGSAGAFHDAVVQNLRQRGIALRNVAPDAVATLTAADVDGVGCIALTALDSQTQLRVARALVRNPATRDVAMEYAALPRLEYEPIAGWDRYQNGDFVSPLSARSGTVFADLYRESLQRFRQKTDIRDFLDLAQILQGIHDRGVAGNVAEFGSFQGHSGYLISRVLENLGSERIVYLFDMFEHFPQESVGVDRFWSGTHAVNFETVWSRFADRPNVRLIKGDFTQTVMVTDTGPLGLAFIDCDSYRATRALLESIWDTRLSPGGVVALEDYGHPALLGNRVAVHEFFDGRRDAVTWYSAYSGFFIATKSISAPLAAS